MFYFSAEIPYEVVIHTGDVRGAGTDANVILVLYGEKGKSDEFKLRNKTDNFERDKVDKFKVHILSHKALCLCGLLDSLFSNNVNYVLVAFLSNERRVGSLGVATLMIDAV